MRHLMFSALVLAMGMTAQAGHKKPCAPTCAPCPKPACEYKVVECKVMVPEWTSETKTITCIEYHQEKQERTVKYREMVPTKETKTKDVKYYERVKKTRDVKYTSYKKQIQEIEEKYWVCEPKTMTRKGTRSVCKPHWTEVDEEYTVWVSHTETSKVKVWVWKCVPVTKKRWVCEDKGKWEERKVTTCCNGCPVICTQRCWVPNIVKTEVAYESREWKKVEEERECTRTVCKPKKETRKVKKCEWVKTDEEYEYEECVLEKVEKSRTRRVCRLIPEEKTRKVCYTECVPKTKTVEYTVCTWNCVEKEKKITELVCVAKEVKKEVKVPVCRMVEKTVQRRVRVHSCCKPCCVPCCK
jgi:hypothetical protein